MWKSFKPIFIALLSWCFLKIHIMVSAIQLETHVIGMQKAKQSRTSIGIATWNILDIEGTFNKDWGMPTEIELAKNIGENGEAEVIETRKFRVLQHLRKMIKKHDLQIIGFQELDEEWRYDVIEFLKKESFEMICLKGGAALFSHTEFFKVIETSDYDFNHSKKPGEGGCAAMVEIKNSSCGDTSEGEKFIFSAIHVNGSLRKTNKKFPDESIISKWGQEMLEAISNPFMNLQKLNLQKPPPIVVLADFNVDLNSVAHQFKTAGWTPKTISDENSSVDQEVIWNPNRSDKRKFPIL